MVARRRRRRGRIRAVGHPVRSPACAAVCRPGGLRARSNLHGGAVVVAARLRGRTCGDKVGYVQSQPWSAMPAPWLALWPHWLAPCRRGRRCHLQSEALQGSRPPGRALAAGGVGSSRGRCKSHDLQAGATPTALRGPAATTLEGCCSEKHKFWASRTLSNESGHGEERCFHSA